MGRAFRIAIALAVVAAVGALGSTAGASSASTTPRWVLHVQRYPGGISPGVRAYLSQSAAAARQYAGTERNGSVSGRSGGVTTATLVNVQANTDSSPPLPQNETQVAVNPNDADNAVAAANDYVDGGLWIGTTHDGGNTWTSTFVAAEVQVTRDFCSGGDPSVIYSVRDSAFYASELCFMRAHPESEMEILRSTDNGNTWTAPRYGARPISNVNPDGSVDDSVFYDKEQLAVDNNPSSPHYGRVYITFIKFHMEPNGFSDYCPVQLAYTDDIDANNDGDLRDTTWSHTAVMPDNPGDNGVGTTANQGAQPMVDNNGGVNVSFFSEDCNTSLDRRILFKRSTTGGASFGSLIQINKPGEWKDNPNKSDLLPNKFARFPASTSAPLVFNPVTHAFEFVTQNYVQGNVTGADISFTQSLDYGAHWQHMRFIALSGGNPAPKDQMLPWMAVDPSGVTHAIWFDNRNDSNNVLIETWHTESSDTTTWPNDDISTQSWNPNLSFFSSGAFVGDYNALAVGPSVEYPVWTDGRNTPGPPNGQTDIYTVPN